jgi:photosystem II stability/assembly factor-like uncharacterized protein
VATDPHHANVVLAASATGTLYQSRDAGASWKLLQFPAESRAALHAVRYHSIHPGVVFAAVTSERLRYAGVYRSTDSGASWQRLPAMADRQVWSLAISAGGEIAAGTETGLYLSGDDGDKWQLITPLMDTRIRPIVSLAFDPTQPGTVYVGTPHLAWKTTGLGGKWTAIHDGMPEDSDVFSIAVDPLTPGRLFASACSGLYVSPNGNGAWARVAGISNRTYFVAPHPSLRGHVYAGTSAGLIWSVDDGAHWQTVSPRIARSIAFDHVNPSRLYIATDSGILRSDDGGNHLTAANQGLSAWRLSKLVESKGAIYASTPESAAPPQRVIAGERNAIPGAYALAGGTVLHSTDAGRVWLHLHTPARADALLPMGSDVLLIACGSTIFRSEDGGRIWTGLDTPLLRSVVRDMVRLGGSAVALFADREVHWAPDGIHWIAAAELPKGGRIHGLAGNGSGVFLAATSVGLMRSSDFGQSWSPVRGELGTISIQAIARDPGAPGTFVGASFGNVYASADGGLTWRRVGGGPSIGAIRQVLISAGARRLFALTEEHGVFVWDPGDSPSLK